MPVYLSPGVYIEEMYGAVPAPTRTWSPAGAEADDETSRIQMVAPGCAALIGFTERIPAGHDGLPLRGQPVSIGSWEQYGERFGGFAPRAYLPDAVHGFFANGGTRCYVVSLAALSEADVNLDHAPFSDFSWTGDRRTGWITLQALEDLTLICAPDLMSCYEQGLLDFQAIQSFQYEMVAVCEQRMSCTAILDAPPGLTPDAVRTWRERLGLRSAHGILYYPWVYTATEPVARRKVPPSGHVAGAHLRASETRGAHLPPANEGLRDVSDVELRISRAEQDLLNPSGVNVLRVMPDTSIRIWGARTLSGDAAFQPVQVRAILNVIGRSIEQGTSWVIFQRQDAALRRRVCGALYGFLERLWKAGALAGETASDAFYVADDRDPNDDHLVVTLGVAIHRAREFHTLRVVFVSELAPPLEPEPGTALPLLTDSDRVDGTAVPARPVKPTADDAAVHIFLSYGREDWTQFVQPLVDALRDEGFSVWIDQHLLRGGQDWMDAINAALKACPVMVLCVSPDAMASKHVKVEYRYFFNMDKTIVPLICRDASLPAELLGLQYLAYSDRAALVDRLKELLS